MKKLILKKLKKNNGNNGDKSIDNMKKKLERYLNLGLDINEACKLSNITRMKLEELRINPEFEDFIQKCMTHGEVKSLESIHKASSNGYWQAGAWYLERKYPERYGKKDLFKAEYEAKLEVYKKVLLGILEDLEPSLKYKFLARLNTCDVETSIMNADTSHFNSIDMPKQLTYSAKKSLIDI